MESPFARFARFEDDDEDDDDNDSLLPKAEMKLENVLQRYIVECQ